jgi:hypothetical protein
VSSKMNRFTVVAMIFCSSLVAPALLLKVMANEWDKKTIVTFNHPVEIPGGKILPAGRYVFKLLDSASDRNIVQIFNEDQTHLYATIIAIPNYRLQPTDKTVITFGAREADSAEAIRAWFYPGANWGEEFVYPKTRAVKLAKLTDKPVPSVPSKLASKITMPAKSGNELPRMALRKAPLRAVRPTGEVVAIPEITVSVWGPAQARPQLPLVVNPTSSMKIHPVRYHKVRIVVAIILAVLLAALVGLILTALWSTSLSAQDQQLAGRHRKGGLFGVPPYLRRSSKKDGPKAA